jgi:hypothetical protein
MLPIVGGALIADGAKVAGNVLLRNGFAAEGEVRLYATRIGGDLDCTGGEFQNPAAADIAGSGMALSFHGAKVDGDVLLSDGFAAEGQVRLHNARIGGNLDCTGGKFQNPAEANVANSGGALIADGAKVDGMVSFAGGLLLKDGYGYISLRSEGT